MSLLAAMIVLAAPALCAAAPSQARVVGLADQQAASFTHPQLTALPVRHARLSVAWDALRYGWQREEIDEWMRTTAAAKMTVVVTFGRSRTRPFSLPPAAEYREQARRFMRRYRSVREYSPWNEPNLAIAPRNYDPRRIAEYYRVLRSSCPRCRVLGADLVDTSSLGHWMRAYLRQFAPRSRPKLWGLHNYVDVNSFSSWGTRTMLRLAPGAIWFTETGAIIRRDPTRTNTGDRRDLIRSGSAGAVAATKRVFTLAATSRRITRVYIYHWRAGRSSWDSGLLSAAGTPRASFDVFARQARLAAGRRQPVAGGPVLPGPPPVLPATPAAPTPPRPSALLCLQSPRACGTAPYSSGAEVRPFG